MRSLVAGPGRARRRSAAVLMAALCLAGVISGCGDDGGTPGSASSCEQVMEEAAVTVRGIVNSLQGKSEADLRAANPDDPFGPLIKPLDPYRARAEELGCDLAELRRAACRAYRDITPTGPAAEEFLAQMLSDCVN